MSTSENQTPEELISKITNAAKDISYVKITFPHEGIIFIYDTGTLKLEAKRENSSMTLQQFGERYKEPGLSALLKAIGTHYYVLSSI